MIEIVVLSASCLLTWWLAGENSPLQIHDAPNERSLHEHPTPHTGGVAILAGIALGWGWMALLGDGLPLAMLWIVAAALLVAGVSILDDVLELSPILRLVVHLLAAGILVTAGVSLPFGWFGSLISFFGLVWMLNLYNFMDGMDGFAGGMAVSGFGMMAVAAWLHGDVVFVNCTLIVVFAALGFLVFNFPPARIFMGDAGSATLGLLAGAFALWGVQDQMFPFWFPLLAFSPFIVDATVTLIRRGLRGEKVWQAHREHYYQRLVRAGWGHKKTVLVEYVLMLSVSVSALLGLRYEAWGVALLAAWAIFYIGLMLLAERHIKKGSSL